MDYKILSWNVNGLNSPQKRKRIFHWLVKQNNHVTCLQEVHVSFKDQKYLSNNKLGEVFYALTDKKKKGVALYVKQDLEPKLCFQDGAGRFVGVEVKINFKVVLLIGIYAPNGPKSDFFEDIQRALQERTYDQLILMGDFNGVVNAKLDKYPSKEGKYLTSLPKSFFKLVAEESLIDTWRLMHKERKMFTFHSGRYNTDSRIDMIWTLKGLGICLKDVDFHPKNFSDYNPIEIQIKKLDKTFRWRVNETFLENPENILELKKESLQYFQLNKTQSVSNQIIWVAYKAVLRGKLMAINSKERRLKNKKLKNLENEITEKEFKIKKHPNNLKVKLELSLLKAQFEAMINQEVEWDLKKNKQKYFEHANKPGKYLAWQLRKKRAKKFISTIKDQGVAVSSQKGINRAFFKFYANLYKKN